MQTRDFDLVLGTSVAKHSATVSTVMPTFAERELYVALFALFGGVVADPVIRSCTAGLFGTDL